ncbi:MAG TPA: septum formation initiator family protein [Actinomycetota bacterium]
MDANLPPRSRISPRALVLAVLAFGVLFSAVLPLQRYADVKREVAALNEQLGALEARERALAVEQERLQTDAEIERLAREELGYVRPGEVPFLIVPGKPALKSERVLPEPPARAASPGLLRQWWNALQVIIGS